MKDEDVKIAAGIVEGLKAAPVGHTPELVREMRDAELLPDHHRDLLTAYAWHLQLAGRYPRDSRALLSRFVAYAEAEQDAWDLGEDDFVRRHGFAPRELARVRLVLIGAAAETLEALP